MFAYNARVQKVTKLSPFRLVLTRKPPKPATICLPTMAGTSDVNSSWSQHLRRLQEASLLRKMANANLRQLQETYKANHEKLVRFESTFAPGDTVFIKGAPLSASPAERLAVERYTKLLPRKLGLYRIISVDLEYVKIWQEGIENTESINRITRAPPGNEERKKGVTDETPMANSTEQPHKPREKPEQE